MQTTIDTWDDCEYVIEKGKESIKLTPYKVDTLSKHIFDYGKKVLLLSATIIDHQNFAKTLGIKKYKYIEIDSSFNPTKAPIYASTKVRLNYKNLTSSLPYITKQIQTLCDQHNNEKGIIHTHTTTITEYLQEHLKGTRFLFRLPGIDNEKIIKQHLESTEPTILVSPSLTMGVDLKDDLARFQILVKAAYLPLGDNRIKRLFENNKVWYTNKMLNNIIQACGRGVRSQEDYCATYILDGCITDAVTANKHKLPKYFLKRFH
jgi:Rad3-related DNA helicase